MLQLLGFLFCSCANARWPEEVREQLDPSSPNKASQELDTELALQDLEQPSPVDAAAQAALERGLAFLASQQALERDGSFPAGERETWSPVGVTSLCLLAYLAAGNTSSRGPYSGQVDAALRYLLARVSPSHALYPGYIHDEGDQFSRMHGHGLATLALAQAYGMSPRKQEELLQALIAAVGCIEQSQSSEGGWYYEPIAGSEHEGSITVCLVQAMRAAKDCGVLVDSARIVKAVRYLERSQQENGAFAYALGLPNKTSVALTAAGLATLHATGTYAGKAVDNAYDWLWRELASREEAQAVGDRSLDAPFPYYERFFLAQALWQNREESLFRNWYVKEKVFVLRQQKADGSWVDRPGAARGERDGAFGSSYSTAMNCLFLALPDGLLPLSQR